MPAVASYTIFYSYVMRSKELFRPQWPSDSPAAHLQQHINHPSGPQLLLSTPRTSPIAPPDVALFWQPLQLAAWPETPHNHPHRMPQNYNGCLRAP